MVKMLDSLGVKAFSITRVIGLVLKVFVNNGPGILKNLGIASIYLSGAGLRSYISKELKVTK